MSKALAAKEVMGWISVPCGSGLHGFGQATRRVRRAGHVVVRASVNALTFSAWDSGADRMMGMVLVGAHELDSVHDRKAEVGPDRPWATTWPRRSPQFPPARSTSVSSAQISSMMTCRVSVGLEGLRFGESKLPGQDFRSYRRESFVGSEMVRHRHRPVVARAGGWSSPLPAAARCSIPARPSRTPRPTRCCSPISFLRPGRTSTTMRDPDEVWPQGVRRDVARWLEEAAG